VRAAHGLSVRRRRLTSRKRSQGPLGAERVRIGAFDGEQLVGYTGMIVP
jgi:hypothetical protein